MRVQSVCMGFTTSGECSVCDFSPVQFCSFAAGSQAPARPMSLLQKAAQEAKQRAAASSAPFSGLPSANATQSHGLRLPPTSQLGSHRGLTQGPILASLGSMGGQATRRSNQGISWCVHHANAWYMSKMTQLNAQWCIYRLKCLQLEFKFREVLLKNQLSLCKVPHHGWGHVGAVTGEAAWVGGPWTKLWRRGTESLKALSFSTRFPVALSFKNMGTGTSYSHDLCVLLLPSWHHFSGQHRSPQPSCLT